MAEYDRDANIAVMKKGADFVPEWLRPGRVEMIGFQRPEWLKYLLTSGKAGYDTGAAGWHDKSERWNEEEDVFGGLGFRDPNIELFLRQLLMTGKPSAVVTAREAALKAGDEWRARQAATKDYDAMQGEENKKHNLAAKNLAETRRRVY